MEIIFAYSQFFFPEHQENESLKNRVNQPLMKNTKSYIPYQNKKENADRKLGGALDWGMDPVSYGLPPRIFESIFGRKKNFTTCKFSTLYDR